MLTDPMTGGMYLSHELLPPPFCKMHPAVVQRLAEAGKLGEVVPVRFTKRSGCYYSRKAFENFMRSCEAAARREAGQ